MNKLRYLFVVVLLVSTFSRAEVQIEKIIKDDWIKVESDNFIVFTDSKEKLAEHLVKDLEEFRYFISIILDRPLISGAPPLKVMAIHSKKNYKYLDLPESWAGVFLKGINGNYALANIKDYSTSLRSKSWGNQILMHEYVHFASRNMLDTIFYPAWISEGVAEYLATYRRVDKGNTIRIGSMDVVGDRLWSLRSPTGSRYVSVDIEDLIKTTDINNSWRREDKNTKEKREDQKESMKFYARALVAYHYFQSSSELRNQLNHYLTSINLGVDIDVAFKSAFKIDYEDMNDAIREYISGRYVNSWDYTAGEGGLKFPDVNIKSRKMSDSEILSELTTVLLRFSHYKSDERDQMLKLALAQGDVTAELAVAEYHYLDWKNKWDHFDRLDHANAKLKVFPESAEWQALKAQALSEYSTMQTYVKHPDASRNLSIARNAARKALSVDGYNGRAYLTLGEATIKAIETRDKFLNEAAGALESARLLLGADRLSSILYNEILVYLAMNNPEQMIRALRQYDVSSNSGWIEKGYGRYLKEALEVRALAHSAAEQVDGGLKYHDGSIYIGSVKDGKPQGEGEFRAYFGAKLKGTWQAGIVSGPGVFESSNNYVYTGDINNGYISGEGRVNWPEEKSIKYSEGQFLLGMEHGKHRYTRNDGTVIDGQSHLGAYHGLHDISPTNGSPLKVEFIFGKLLSEPLDGVVFAGGWNNKYQAHGNGTCWDKAKDRVRRCVYNNGKEKVKVVAN